MKKELTIIFGTIAIIILATYLNLLTSFKKSRDITRKNDMWAIHDALVAYQTDIASFPVSEDGKMVACFGGVDKDNVPQRIACEYNVDPLRDIFYSEDEYPDYLKVIPSDPNHSKGTRYVYFSNGRHFQILTSLESEDDPEINPEVVARGIMCGDKVCNFGRTDGQTPLAISVEEYENELRLKYEESLK